MSYIYCFRLSLQCILHPKKVPHSGTTFRYLNDSIGLPLQSFFHYGACYFGSMTMYGILWLSTVSGWLYMERLSTSRLDLVDALKPYLRLSYHQYWITNSLQMYYLMFWAVITNYFDGIEEHCICIWWDNASIEPCWCECLCQALVDLLTLLNLVTYLYWTPIVKWHAVWSGSKYKYQRHVFKLIWTVLKT